MLSMPCCQIRCYVQEGKIGFRAPGGGSPPSLLRRAVRSGWWFGAGLGPDRAYLFCGP